MDIKDLKKRRKKEMIQLKIITFPKTTRYINKYLEVLQEKGNTILELKILQDKSLLIIYRTKL